MTSETASTSTPRTAADRRGARLRVVTRQQVGHGAAQRRRARRVSITARLGADAAVRDRLDLVAR